MKLKPILLAFLLALVFATSALCQTNADFKRIEDVVYGRKDGMALTMDVFKPKNPNGAGIIVCVSGGWFSSHAAINPVFYQDLLKRGYTVFAVVHGSQPRYLVPDAMQDMHRAVRFIRHNAAQYGVDPHRLGVTGGSAGGHLSLVLGTGTGADAKVDDKDPVDHESSAVECVACFFPPTDFLNYGAPGKVETGNDVLKNVCPTAFGPYAKSAEGREKFAREISPIYSITSNMPPTLIIHGDADVWVPIQQSQSFVQKAKEAGATAKLIVKPGAGHGWKDLLADMETFADWFDKYLRAAKAQAQAK